MNPDQLKLIERKAFQSTFSDGLWDVMLGCVVLLFALAPLLSEKLGDFWSSMVFLPFWGLVYLVIWLIRKNMVAPRLGKVTFGQARQQKIRHTTRIIVLGNLILLIIGLVTAITIGDLSPRLPMIIVSGLILLGFYLAANFLDYPRLYFYGTLLSVAPLTGEWLFDKFGISHHGFPLVFGAVSVLIILVGFIQFLHMMATYPAIETPYTRA